MLISEIDAFSKLSIVISLAYIAHAIIYYSQVLPNVHLAIKI